MISKGLAFLFILLSISQAKHYAVHRDLQILEISSELVEFALYDPKVAGIAEFTDNREKDGWTYYYIKTVASEPDWFQMYLAGYMEGDLAYNFVYDTWLNGKMYLTLPTGEPALNKDTKDFILNQTNWMLSQINANPDDNYWKLVNVTLSQVYGMYDGYEAAIKRANRSDMHLTFDDFYIMTYMSDLFDVMAKFNDGVSMKPLKCSFLCKMTNDSLYVSHTTWYDYTGLLRTYKIFDLDLQNPLVQTKRVSFSSQPGFATSQDDFYILDNGRFVAETSLSSNNNDVYDFVHYDSVPYWVRITVANFVFTNQQAWTDAYFAYRSGTYNNQWLVVNFNNYNASKNDLSQAKDIIWMVEEFYELTSSQDVTQELLVSQGYVASYNVPYNPAIETLSENPTDYRNDSRAILFAKYAPGIQNIEEFKYVMRLNNISDTGDYCEAIAARCDLSDDSDFPFGAIDCKVTSDTMAPTHDAWIIAGPTTEDVPPFNWADWPQYNDSRYGMVDLWNFNWTYMSPDSNFSLSAPEYGPLPFEGYYAFIMEGNAIRY